MNSSSEMVKEISSAETRPGATSGRVTLRKADQRVSPKSRAASSIAGSSDWNAPLRTAMAKGVQISTWPATTVSIDSSSPIWRNTTSSATATMISGSTSGSMIPPRIAVRPGKAWRVPARAAHTPRSVARMAVTTAISSELPAASRSAPTSTNSVNQRVVKPWSGKATMVLSLKAKSGSSAIGA